MSLLKKTLTILIYWMLININLITDANANSYTVAQLQQIAVEFIEGKVKVSEDGKTTISAIPLETKVQSRYCSQTLDLSTPTPPPITSRQVTVQLKCLDMPGWRQYVHVRIDTLMAVVIVKQSLPKGTILAPDDLSVEYKSKRFIRASHLHDSQLLIGSKLKRNLRAGQAVSMQSVCMVCKNDAVNILARSNTLLIKTSGTALQDGNLGQQIRVKNSKSGKIIKARVSGVESVEVSL